MSKPRTQLFMTLQGAVLYLIGKRYTQDDFGEWYGIHNDRDVHAEIQRRPNGVAIVFNHYN